MRTRVSLVPGQRGTKRLSAEHGDRLVRIRYRYDESPGQSFKSGGFALQVREEPAGLQPFCG